MILGVYFCDDMCASSIEDNWLERTANIKRLFPRGKKAISAQWEKYALLNIFDLTVCVYYASGHNFR